MTEAPKAVVWDIGNVLLDWSPDYLYRRLIPDDEARAAFYGRLPFDEMNLAGIAMAIWRRRSPHWPRNTPKTPC